MANGPIPNTPAMIRRTADMESLANKWIDAGHRVAEADMFRYVAKGGKPMWLADPYLAYTVNGQEIGDYLPRSSSEAQRLMQEHRMGIASGKIRPMAADFDPLEKRIEALRGAPGGGRVVNDVVRDPLAMGFEVGNDGKRVKLDDAAHEAALRQQLRAMGHPPANGATLEELRTDYVPGPMSNLPSTGHGRTRPP